MGYDERLTLPWTWWAAGAALAGLAGAELHLGYGGLRAWLPYVVAVLVVGAGLARLGTAHVRVDAGRLTAGGTGVPLSAVTGAFPLDRAAKRRLLGPDADRAARVFHRPWIPTAVAVLLDPAAGPAPYWLVSTRRPERLAEVLLTRRAGCVT